MLKASFLDTTMSLLSHRASMPRSLSGLLFESNQPLLFFFLFNRVNSIPHNGVGVAELAAITLAIERFSKTMQ
jgi:hypothetical protein